MKTSMIRKQDPSGLASPMAWRDPTRMMRELLRWDPFQELGALPAWEGSGFVPGFDVKETPEALILQADLPGLTEKDVNISLTGNRLTVTGERRAEQKREGESYYTLERSFGAFTRSFTLPEEVNIDKVQAELKDGVLTLTLPKRPEAKPRQIPLKGGK